MEKYFIYKHIFSGASSIDDIIFLRSKCPVEDYQIIDSITRSQNFQQCISNIQMNKIIKTLVSLKYKDECNKYLDEFKNKKYNNCLQFDQSNYNSAQTDTFAKIISTKLIDESYIDFPKIEKECPHCGRINKAPFGTKYIVCGIDTMGIFPMDNFDNACLNDWCFTCGKKLCKNWYTNQLYDEANRTHDKNCCKIHALKYNNQYPLEYCQCFRHNEIII